MVFIKQEHVVSSLLPPLEEGDIEFYLEVRAESSTQKVTVSSLGVCVYKKTLLHWTVLVGSINI